MQITVEQLFYLCKEQMAQGNGKRKILISDDTEGNGFHGLFYGFTKIIEEDKEWCSISDTQEEDVNKILILG